MTDHYDLAKQAVFQNHEIDQAASKMVQVAIRRLWNDCAAVYGGDVDSWVADMIVAHILNALIDHAELEGADQGETLASLGDAEEMVRDWLAPPPDVA